MIEKMKMWMFECTGEWNVFTFTDEQTIMAYKATVEAYERYDKKWEVSNPPFAVESFSEVQFHQGFERI